MAKKSTSGDSKARTPAADTLIVVCAQESVTTRGSSAKELDVSALADNIKAFLQKIEKILQSVPASAGGFALTEFEVSAEITASGSLGLLGTGVEVGGKGGLTFKFQKR
jgi:hypothetical protein